VLAVGSGLACWLNLWASGPAVVAHASIWTAGVQVAGAQRAAVRD
jgi:hypothetical protein